MDQNQDQGYPPNVSFNLSNILIDIAIKLIKDFVPQHICHSVN